jgi:hypothetical protein
MSSHAGAGLENAVGWEQMRDMAHVVADTVIEMPRRRL